MPNSDDPYLLTLGWIAAELTAIRKELQAHRPEPAEAAAERFECRCGETIIGKQNAQQHATADHKAPADHWGELYA